MDVLFFLSSRTVSEILLFDRYIITIEITGFAFRTQKYSVYNTINSITLYFFPFFVFFFSMSLRVQSLLTNMIKKNTTMDNFFSGQH